MEHQPLLNLYSALTLNWRFTCGIQVWETTAFINHIVNTYNKTAHIPNPLSSSQKVHKIHGIHIELFCILIKQDILHDFFCMNRQIVCCLLCVKYVHEDCRYALTSYLTRYTRYNKDCTEMYESGIMKILKLQVVYCLNTGPVLLISKIYLYSSTMWRLIRVNNCCDKNFALRFLRSYRNF